MSQSEIESRQSNWIDSVFAGQILNAPAPNTGLNLIDRVLRGGYPEALSRASAKRRVTWARQYIEAIVQRDVSDVAEVANLDKMPRFLRTLSQTAGQMCNYTQLGAQVGLDGKTVSRYIGIFEQLYLLKRIDVWAPNRLSRMIKTPKLQFLDSGLLAALIDLSREEIADNKIRFGNLLESFVYAELLKHSSTADADYRLMYYRDADKFEVDVVIENAAGQLVGIEVKASASVKAADLRGLRKFASLAGKHFKMGVLLYDGTETLPLGNGIWAAPLATLWGQQSKKSVRASPASKHK